MHAMSVPPTWGAQPALAALNRNVVSAKAPSPRGAGSATAGVGGTGVLGPSAGSSLATVIDALQTVVERAVATHARGARQRLPRDAHPGRTAVAAPRLSGCSPHARRG